MGDSFFGELAPSCTHPLSALPIRINDQSSRILLGQDVLTLFYWLFYLFNCDELSDALTGSNLKSWRHLWQKLWKNAEGLRHVWLFRFDDDGGSCACCAFFEHGLKSWSSGESFANLEPRTKKHNIVIERSKMIQKDCTFVYFCHYCSEVTWLNGFSLKRLGTGQFRSESLRRTRVLPEHAKMKDVCCKM